MTWTKNKTRQISSGWQKSELSQSNTQDNIKLKNTWPWWDTWNLVLNIYFHLWHIISATANIHTGMSDEVEDFRLCILWSQVRSPEKITYLYYHPYLVSDILTCLISSAFLLGCHHSFPTPLCVGFSLKLKFIIFLSPFSVWVSQVCVVA